MTMSNLTRTDELRSFHEHAKLKDNLYKELSKKPKENAVKINKYANNSKYLDIGYIEAQLDRLFLSWNWEVKEVKQMYNGIVVSGILEVFAPNGVKIIRSGVGGVEMQTESKTGKLQMDLSNMAKGAMDRDAGRAEAYALKNAASKLGNIFGRNLNRDFNLEHIPDSNLISKIYGNDETI